MIRQFDLFFEPESFVGLVFVFGINNEGNNNPVKPNTDPPKPNTKLAKYSKKRKQEKPKS